MKGEFFCLRGVAEKEGLGTRDSKHQGSNPCTPIQLIREEVSCMDEGVKTFIWICPDCGTDFEVVKEPEECPLNCKELEGVEPSPDPLTSGP